MKGTEKQIKWAEDIKTNAINFCTGRINVQINLRGNADGEEARLWRILRASIAQTIDKLDDAAKIIDKRGSFKGDQLDMMIIHWGLLIKNGKATVDKIAEANHVMEY